MRKWALDRMCLTRVAVELNRYLAEMAAAQVEGVKPGAIAYRYRQRGSADRLVVHFDRTRESRVELELGTAREYLAQLRAGDLRRFDGGGV